MSINGYRPGTQETEMGFFSSSLAFLVLVTLNQVQAEVADTPTCDEGWEYISGYCYSFFIKPVSWPEAELQCQDYSKNGHLVSLHDEKEQAAVIGLLWDLQYFGPFWVGLFTDSKVLWLWTDESKYDYAEWAPGEPDCKGSHKFFCVQLSPIDEVDMDVQSDGKARTVSGCPLKSWSCGP
ncbi:snaclec VP12 subunit B-like [Sphaerodactylus townsendi]|uniref:snaclec VP12 subunit B-like n=1 Tax=Sphaerodactylus townsendi TaxID=933632 RepID=UPI0020266316|nr:snaclec VP12 subunit B-like [Sphaerodactylus townsendi]